MSEQPRIPQKIVNAGRNLLGLSNMGRLSSRGPALSHAEAHIRPAVAGVDDILVIPHAAKDMDKAVASVTRALVRLGAKESAITSLHSEPGAAESKLTNARVIYLAGGDTYHLTANMEGLRNADGSLVDPRPGALPEPVREQIRKKVAEGVMTMGASAGLMVMFDDVRGAHDPTSSVMKTSDGQPVVSVKGLGLISDSLNVIPHYNDPLTDEQVAELTQLHPLMEGILDQVPDMGGHIGYILQFDPERKVLGIRDDAYFEVKGDKMTLHGTGETGAALFEAGKSKQDIQAPADLSHLLTSK